MKSEGETLVVFANGHKRRLIKGKDVKYGSILHQAKDIFIALKNNSG